MDKSYNEDPSRAIIQVRIFLNKSKYNKSKYSLIFKKIKHFTDLNILKLIFHLLRSQRLWSLYRKLGRHRQSGHSNTPTLATCTPILGQHCAGVYTKRLWCHNRMLASIAFSIIINTTFKPEDNIKCDMPYITCLLFKCMMAAVFYNQTDQERKKS